MRSRKAKSLSQLFIRKLPIASSAVESMSPRMLRRSPSHESASLLCRRSSISRRACSSHGVRSASASFEADGTARRVVLGIILTGFFDIKSFLSDRDPGRDYAVKQFAYYVTI